MIDWQDMRVPYQQFLELILPRWLEERESYEKQRLPHLGSSGYGSCCVMGVPGRLASVVVGGIGKQDRKTEIVVIVISRISLLCTNKPDEFGRFQLLRAHKIWPKKAKEGAKVAMQHLGLQSVVTAAPAFCMHHSVHLCCAAGSDICKTAQQSSLCLSCTQITWSKENVCLTLAR